MMRPALLPVAGVLALVTIELAWRVGAAIACQGAVRALSVCVEALLATPPHPDAPLDTVESTETLALTEPVAS
jgi:hypothetical protein